MTVTESSFERVSDDIRRLVDITQTVRLVDHHEIPRSISYVRGFVASELVRADNNRIFNLKRAEVAQFDNLVVVARFQDSARQKELLRHFLLPLLTQI